MVTLRAGQAVNFTPGHGTAVAENNHIISVRGDNCVIRCHQKHGMAIPTGDPAHGWERLLVPFQGRCQICHNSFSTAPTIVQVLSRFSMHIQREIEIMSLGETNSAISHI